MKTGGSNEGKILTFAISGCSELMTIPFRTRAGRVSLYDLIHCTVLYDLEHLRTDDLNQVAIHLSILLLKNDYHQIMKIRQFKNNLIFLSILIKSIS